MCWRCEINGLKPSSVARAIQYTPDFFFKNRTIVIEAKGRFDAAHRAKALAFKEQYPDTDYRLLFESDNKISPKSKTRYTDWCRKHGIECAVGLIPSSWIRELA